MTLTQDILSPDEPFEHQIAMHERVIDEMGDFLPYVALAGYELVYKAGVIDITFEETDDRDLFLEIVAGPYSPDRDSLYQSVLRQDGIGLYAVVTDDANLTGESGTSPLFRTKISVRFGYALLETVFDQLWNHMSE